MAILYGLVVSLALAGYIRGSVTPLPNCNTIKTEVPPSSILVPESCPENVTVVTYCQLFGLTFCVYINVPPTESPPVMPECGLKVGSKIFGGSNDGSCEPWLASIQFKEERNGARTFSTCSAVLVGKTTLVTAASCFDFLIVGTKPQVVIGDNATFVTESNEQLKPVSEVIVHSGYNPVTKENNIAILKLDVPVFLSPCTFPICLPVSKDDYGKSCQIGGYGKKQESDTNLSDLLQIGEVLILPDKLCKQKPKHTVCATSINTDACEGDDGGMLACPGSNGRFQLAGLIGDSSTYSCARKGSPSYYTDIAVYREWIASHS